VSDDSISSIETDPGLRNAHDAFNATYFDSFLQRLGMKGLNYIIREVLDRHYPKDIFGPGDIQYGVNWASNHGGEDIQPGVKWAELLRMALAEVEK
jgi:hypothetical protein